jgi:hypothetical protein
MDPTERYMWIAFIVFTCLNAAVWWRRGQRQIAEDPRLAEGYGRLVRGLIVFGNIPWLVMGAGIMSGRVSGMDDFMRPPANPFVLAFDLTVVGLWIALARWVFWRNGAEELAEHPGLMNLGGHGPTAIKWLVGACLASGVVAMAGILSGSGPGSR